jgi:hypothetical protein
MVARERLIGRGVERRQDKRNGAKGRACLCLHVVFSGATAFDVAPGLQKPLILAAFRGATSPEIARDGEPVILRAGFEWASPSSCRQARAADAAPLRASGLDRPPPARQGLAKRARLSRASRSRREGPT